MLEDIADAEAGMDDRRGGDAGTDILNRDFHMTNLGCPRRETRKIPKRVLGKDGIIR
jgi:hypothetical protein